jgi:hypothetical protein
MTKREWNTPVREPWNPVIHNLLKAIDEHNKMYFKTCDQWHLEKARQLRAYVREIKDWIKSEET